MRNDVVVSMPSAMWRRAVELASRMGHDLERDVLTPAVLDYVKIQVEVTGGSLGRCSACNATTVDDECLDCGRITARA